MPTPCDRTSKLLLYKQGWCSSRCCAKTLGADYPHTASLSQGICAFAGVPPRGLSPTPSACFLTIPQQKHFSKLLISASLEKWKCPCVASLGFLWFQWVLSVSVFYQPEGKCAGHTCWDEALCSEEGAVACWFICQGSLFLHTCPRPLIPPHCHLPPSHTQPLILLSHRKPLPVSFLWPWGSRSLGWVDNLPFCLNHKITRHQEDNRLYLYLGS